MGELKRLHAIVYGRVQGVSFRYNTTRRAVELGITGWVRNLPDRTVEVTAEGDDEAMEKLVAYLKVGPTGAHVTTTDIKWLKASGEFTDFTIR